MGHAQRRMHTNTPGTHNTTQTLAHNTYIHTHTHSEGKTLFFLLKKKMKFALFSHPTHTHTPQLLLVNALMPTTVELIYRETS